MRTLLPGVDKNSQEICCKEFQALDRFRFSVCKAWPGYYPNGAVPNLHFCVLPARVLLPFRSSSMHVRSDIGSNSRAVVAYLAVQDLTSGGPVVYA